MVEYFHLGDTEEAYNAAADVISEAVGDLLEVKDKVVLAVPGGRNVGKVFENLRKKNLPWEKIHFFMVDERFVDFEAQESNYRILKENLVDQLLTDDKLPGSNIHPFVYEPEEDDDGLREYEEELKMVGGSFDIVLLSAGEDCHVGALFPDHHSIKNESDYFLTINDSPKTPKERMTSSRKLLERSKVALLLFLGEEKKGAYDKFTDEKLEVEQCPAKLINTIANSFVFTDFKE